MSETPHTPTNLQRDMGLFRSWAAAFGFVSIATGIFTAYGAMLMTSGYAGIWTWVIVAVGQFCVAVVFGLLASRIPITGYAYQWVSRLTSPLVGWVMGWLSFTFLSVVVVAVDYTVASTLLPAITGPVTLTDAWAITALILTVQALLVAGSTRASLKVNGVAVIFELLGVIGLIVLLLAAGLISNGFHADNLFSTAPVSSASYLSFGGATEVGPWMLAVLMGSFTIVGFETAANLAEETKNPQRVVPRAMMISVGSVGILGMLLLIAATMLAGDASALSSSPTPLADIVSEQLGSVVGNILLVCIIISIFSCGLMITLSNSRLVWAMSRDERFPFWRHLSTISPSRRTPLRAAVFVLIVSQIILALFARSTDALFTLFAAGSLLPALIYAGTVVTYIVKRSSLPPAPEDAFRLSRPLERTAVVAASVWLVFELSIFRDSSFKMPWLYVASMLTIGAAYLALLIFKRGGVDKLAMPDLHSIDATFDQPEAIDLTLGTDDETGVKTSS